MKKETDKNKKTAIVVIGPGGGGMEKRKGAYAKIRFRHKLDGITYIDENVLGDYGEDKKTMGIIEELEKKSVHSIIESGEIYTTDFFKNHGSKGGKKGGGKWFKSLTVDERKEHLEKMAKGRVIHK